LEEKLRGATYATLMSWHGRILVHLACKIWGKTLGPGLIARKSSACLHGCWQACTKVNDCTDMYIFNHILPENPLTLAPTGFEE